ncbi:MAG: Spo0B domain-containing protein [Thermoanaerobacterales bacterium]|nr:Spo0B domain-containing protein [Thermoanaerobacterales bacterium]
MDELLRFIRIYGHDFLNHLQVISGYAQLHKTEHIREYIGQVTAEIRAVSRVTLLSAPEGAAGLLSLRESAARYGVPLVINIEGDLPPTTAAGALRRALACLGDVFAPLEGTAAPAVLTVAGSGETAVVLVLPAERAVLGTALDRPLEEAGRHLAEAGGRIETQDGVGGVTIRLVIPAAGQPPGEAGAEAASANATGAGR